MTRGLLIVTQWFPWFLLLHVMAAIVAFGPTFTFPLIARMGATEREHANFSVRVSAAISKRITIPAALTMPVSGALMIWATGIAWTQLWLDAGILLYVIAVAYAVLVQTPTVERLIALTGGTGTTGASAGHPGPAVAGAGAPGGVASPPAGPPPDVAATIRRVQQGGMLLTALIVAIVCLMVARPTI